MLQMVNLEVLLAEGLASFPDEGERRTLAEALLAYMLKYLFPDFLSPGTGTLTARRGSHQSSEIMSWLAGEEMSEGGLTRIVPASSGRTGRAALIPNFITIGSRARLLSAPSLSLNAASLFAASEISADGSKHSTPVDTALEWLTSNVTSMARVVDQAASNVDENGVLSAGRTSGSKLKLIGTGCAASVYDTIPEQEDLHYRGPVVMSQSEEVERKFLALRDWMLNSRHVPIVASLVSLLGGSLAKTLESNSVEQMEDLLMSEIVDGDLCVVELFGAKALLGTTGDGSTMSDYIRSQMQAGRAGLLPMYRQMCKDDVKRDPSPVRQKLVMKYLLAAVGSGLVPWSHQVAKAAKQLHNDFDEDAEADTAARQAEEEREKEKKEESKRRREKAKELRREIQQRQQMAMQANEGQQGAERGDEGAPDEPQPMEVDPEEVPEERETPLPPPDHRPHFGGIRKAVALLAQSMVTQREGLLASIKHKLAAIGTQTAKVWELYSLRVRT
ncbi:unnamed protein product, partial [Amoebophrya sp. A25]|eukprot:GSA25T00004109001.1